MAADEDGDLTAKFSGATVTLTVGDFDDILRGRESLLKLNSPFFRAARDRDWRERNTRKIYLPDDNVAIVAGYLEWIYCSRGDVGACHPEFLLDLARHLMIVRKDQPQQNDMEQIHKWLKRSQKEQDQKQVEESKAEDASDDYSPASG